MPVFNLEDYEPVQDRITRFYADHPTGRIITASVSPTDRLEKGVTVVFYAAVYRDMGDEHAWATGHAAEEVGQGMINQRNALENCETSAIGRALANAGYAGTAAQRPSKEEMMKASRSAPRRGRAAPAHTAPTTAAQTIREGDQPLLLTKSMQQKLAITAKDLDIPTDLRYRITRITLQDPSHSGHSADVPRKDMNRVIEAMRRYADDPASGKEILLNWEGANPP